MTVTYNSAPVLPRFLACLRRCADFSALNLRTYVVDNASSDESVSLARQAGCAVVSLPTNVGFAAGTNIGIRHALRDGCAWVLMLNNDTAFEKDLVDRLVARGDADRQPVVSPLILTDESPPRIWYGGGAVSRWRAFRVTHLHMDEPLSGQVASGATPFAPGCCLLVKAEMFRLIGLLDETFFVYAEDLDLCIRLRSRGVNPFVDAKVALVHSAGALTGGTQSLFGARESTRGRVLLLRKHLRLWERVVPTAYIATWIAARFLTGRDGWSVLKARVRGGLSGLVAAFVPGPAGDINELVVPPPTVSREG